VKSELIPVTVRLNIGATNLARASSGARAQHASATSDGESAAKYFRCPEAEIGLTLIAQGDACSNGRVPARYMAEKKPALSPLALQALRAVGTGVDVFSPALARTLRELEKLEPKLLTIVPAQTSDEAGCRAYFGAKLTAAGLTAVKGGK
jgi:hypothetical protein